MDRLERIKAARAAMDAKAIAEIQKKNDKVARLTNAIKALSGRLAEMMKVADCMVENRMSFGGTWYSCGMAYGDFFETNGIKHGIGFVFQYESGRGRNVNNRVGVIGIGIEGGGCCGNDIVIDRDGDIIKNPLDHVIGCWTKENAYYDFCSKANEFLKGFNEFEKKFYDYVDNLAWW